MTIAEKLVTIAEKMQKIHAAGQKKEYNRFWDLYQNSGEIAGYAYAFAGFRWNDCTYTPKYPIVVSNATCMFQDCYITDTKVAIDISNGSGNSIFYYASKMVNIRKLVVNENMTFNGTFTGCIALEEIRFEGAIGKSLDIHWSTKLSAESYESILDCLSTTSSGQTLTLPTTAEDTYDATHGSGAWAERVKGLTNWEIKYA